MSSSMCQMTVQSLHPNYLHSPQAPSEPFHLPPCQGLACIGSSTSNLSVLNGPAAARLRRAVMLQQADETSDFECSSGLRRFLSAGGGNEKLTSRTVAYTTTVCTSDSHSGRKAKALCGGGGTGHCPVPNSVDRAAKAAVPPAHHMTKS